MGFISFNEKYYRQRLEILENKPLSNGDVYEIRQLLKVLDDLTDEGYTNLNNYMEDNFSCLTRLRTLLKKAGASPFPVNRGRRSDTSYHTEELELNALLDVLIAEAREIECAFDNPFIKNIYEYSQWIGHEEETAYVFLLRDTLLPYIYFKSRYGKSIYPWLIGRRFLEDVTGIKNVDDDIRLSVYEALECECTAFENFCDFCKGRIKTVLEEHSELKHLLLGLLGSIKEKRIVVVESGYAGTIPMMLKALDERVSFKLYATAPFLNETYRELLFCHRYEDIRKFETGYSQDLLLRYSSFHNGKFYVNLSEEDIVRKNSLREVKSFIG